MWRLIALCASLFGSAAMGLAVAAQWLAPGVRPAAVAVGMCAVGVLLILLAPPRPADAAPASGSGARLQPALATPSMELPMVALPPPPSSSSPIDSPREGDAIQD